MHEEIANLFHHGLGNFPGPVAGPVGHGIERQSIIAALTLADGRSSPSSSGTAPNYDALGRVVSRESTSGNRTMVYDASGRNVERYTTNR